MADNTATPPSNSATDYKAELKPVGRWNTLVTKFAAASGMAISAASVAIGVVQLITGKAVDLNQDEFVKDRGAASLQGAAFTAFGLSLGGLSNAMYGSASGATRARNFAKLHSELNAQQATGRG